MRMWPRGTAWTGQAAFALALALAAAPVAAHDTWLQALESPAAGLISVSVSTGTHFPIGDSAPSMDGLARSGCVDGRGRSQPLQPREARPAALVLRARIDASTTSYACWIETRPTRVSLAPALVDTYLREVQAPEAVRARWREQHQRGIEWRETFIKQARLEQALPGSVDAVRAPVAQGLELRLLGSEPARVGQALAVEVLLDGRPLEGLAVQLVSERLPLGPWQRSDARGRLAFPALAFPGRWLLRATRIVPADAPDGEWTSRFSTLMIDVR